MTANDRASLLLAVALYLLLLFRLYSQSGALGEHR